MRRRTGQSQRQGMGSPAEKGREVVLDLKDVIQELSPRVRQTEK